MSLYYAKQDNTIWGCGESGCCGPYYEDIQETFIEIYDDGNPVDAERLQSEEGGGPILSFKIATHKQAVAYESGKMAGYEDGWSDGFAYNHKLLLHSVRKRILKDSARDTVARNDGDTSTVDAILLIVDQMIKEAND